MPTTRYIGRITLFIIHLTFVIGLSLYSADFYTYLPIVLGSLSVLLYYFKVSKEDSLKRTVEDYTVFIFIPIGALSTYYLSIYWQLGPVLSAALVGLSASYLFPIFSQRSSVGWLTNAEVPVYCGAFVGMCSSDVASGITFIVLASFFSSGLYLLTLTTFKGIGGKLGTIAFGGVVLAVVFLNGIT